VVDVTGATHDETTSFQEINGGRFVGHEETVEDPPADDREDDNNNSGGGGGGGGGKPRRPALTPVLVPPANLSIFTRDLSLGAAGADVRQLQIFLNNHGFLVVARGPGAPGAETDFFSASTRAALGRFQVAQGLVASSESVNFGVLDALTRQRLNSLVAATPVTDPQVLIQELRRQLLTLLQQLALLLSQRP
jgi:peptidoglycan hydrolase-like protein with peptidoglycan-binding domain